MQQCLRLTSLLLRKGSMIELTRMYLMQLVNGSGWVVILIIPTLKGLTNEILYLFYLQSIGTICSSSTACRTL
jgi:hypothetical protein